MSPWPCREQHGHGFRCTGAFVQERRIGHLHPCEVQHHGLKIEQGFEATLGNLRLVWRVSRVPSWVFQNIAADHTWNLRGVVAHADVIPKDGILGRQAVDVLEVLAFCQGCAHIHGLTQPDRTGYGLFNEVVQRR